jgi:excinuclease ABC subunit C
MHPMNSQHLKERALPDKPGVYLFKKGGDILYIGKATSLRDRTRSYFVKDLIETRSVSVADMVALATSIDFEVTDTALEALLLEAELIKRYKPKYNTKEKDDKSFNYVIITNDPIPRIELIRGRNLKIEKELSTLKPKYAFGPFTSGSAILEGLRIIRRIFPYIDRKAIQKDTYEFYKQLGLTPDTTNTEALNKYKENIKHIVLFFQGKKKKIISDLKKDMQAKAKALKFEEANLIKKQIFALEHINDIAVIKSDFFGSRIDDKSFRIESYDIAHLGGKEMVGVMTVIQNREVDKTEYKKFIIRSQTGANDTGALHEVLMRRFRHIEWGLPELVVVDGGIAQINVTEQVLKFYQLKIPVVSVLKDEQHKPKDILGDKILTKEYKKEILLANSESHRFAITFHKLKRDKNFIKK